MAKNAVIAALSVNLSANTVKFNRALNRSKKRSKSWAQSTTKTVKGVAAGFAGLGVSAVAALIAINKQQGPVIDKLAKTSDKLGITTEKLAGLRLAADLTGVSQNNLDLGLQRMTRRLAEAAQGTGEAKNAIRELGLDAKKLAASSPDQAFSEITEAMAKIPNQSDKVRLSFKLFDTEGVNLVNTMRLGADGLARAQEEARLFGVALSRIDAAQVEKSNDAATKLKTLYTGFSQQLTVKFAPVLEAISNKFIGIAKDAGGMGNVAESAFQKIVSAVGFVADAFRGIQVVFGVVKLAFTGLAAGIATGIKFILDGASALANGIIDGVVYPFKKALEVIAPFSDTAQEGLNKLNGFVESFRVTTPQAVADMAAATQEHLGVVAKEVDALANKEMPSTNFKNFVTEIVEVSRAGAAEIAANSPAAAMQRGNNVAPLSEKLQKDYAAVLSFLGQREMAETNAYLRRQEIINEYFDTLEIPNEEARKERLHQLEIDHQNKLIQAKAKGLHTHSKLIADFNSWEVKTTTEKANMVIGITKSIAGAMGNESKKAFKVMKIARIAEAVMNTYAGINQALASLPPPASFVAAAAIGALGIANVAKIKKQQFRSSSSAASVVPISGGGSFKSTNTPAVPNIEEQTANANQNANENTNVNSGDTYYIYGTGNDGKKLVEEIRKEIIEGAEIIPARTRQSQALAEEAA